MIDITFEINGRKVNPKNVGDALEAAVISQVADSIKKTVGSSRCNEHGQRPKIKVKGKNLDNLSFEVSGCCEALIGEVSAKFK
jgi:hypothetical protein